MRPEKSMLLTTAVLLAGVLVVPASSCAAEPSGVLAPNGQPYREIVIAPDAPSMTALAARELSHYLAAVTGGGPVPVIDDGLGTGARPAIFVGESGASRAAGVTAEGLALEGFRIVSRDDTLAIVGRDYAGPPIHLERNPWRLLEMYNKELGLNAMGEAGTLYGVYRFLEDEAGVRWYWPAPDGEVLPEPGTLKVRAFALEDAPRFNYRYPWYCLGQQDGQQLLWLRRARFGGDAPVYAMHNFNIFLKYKDTHPEYFALVDGQRDFDKLCCVGGGGHLCLTNPEVRARWVEEIRGWFDAHPEQRFFPLVPMDGLTRVCGCDGCQAEVDNDEPREGKFSNHIWGFANAVAIEVAKTHPDKFIGCLAYSTYRNPPSRVGKLSPNLLAMIVYRRSDMAMPRDRDALRAHMEKWKEYTHNIYTWNWYLEHWGAWRGLPVASPDFWAEEFRFLAGLGVWKGEFIEAEGGGQQRGQTVSRMNDPGMQHLPLYISARAMWNPDFDPAAVMDEYYRLFYGPAEASMRAFWEKSGEAYMAAAAKITAGTKNNLSPEDVYTAGLLEELSGLLDAARAAAPEDSAYRRRIDVIRGEFLPAKQNLVQYTRLGNQQLTLARIANPKELDNQPLQRFVSREGGVAAQQTWMAAGYDQNNLYFRFFCYETDMAGLKARDGRDAFGMWEDDAVEIFLAPDPRQPEETFQFIINANGAIWDGRRGFGINLAVEWNAPGAKAKVRREANRWVLDATIPFRDLEIGGAKPEAMAGNFLRGHAAGGQKLYYTCWSPPFEPNNYSPGRWGALILGKE